jgi:hypothetical protein
MVNHRHSHHRRSNDLKLCLDSQLDEQPVVGDNHIGTGHNLLMKAVMVRLLLVEG